MGIFFFGWFFLSFFRWHIWILSGFSLFFFFLFCSRLSLTWLLPWIRLTCGLGWRDKLHLCLFFYFVDGGDWLLCIIIRFLLLSCFDNCRFSHYSLLLCTLPRFCFSFRWIDSLGLCNECFHLLFLLRNLLLQLLLLGGSFIILLLMKPW